MFLYGGKGTRFPEKNKKIRNAMKPNSIFRHGKHEYRSLGIGKLSRLIYRIDGETIRILYLWNTRQNPITLKEMFQ